MTSRAPGIRPLLVAAAALAVAAAPSSAQTGGRFSVVPLAGATWQGHRYKADVAIPSMGAQGEARLGPTRGAELGLAAEFRGWGGIALTASATYSALDYEEEDPGGGRSIFGELDLLRFTAGLKYRIVPSAPGYFSAGVLANAMRPGEPEIEVDRTEVGGYGGVGLDIGGGRSHLRVEGRLMVVAPNADPVISPTSLRFEPRDILVDFAATVGFVIGI